MTHPSQKAPRDVPVAGIVASVSTASGVGLVIAGVHVLAGTGWALLAAGVPFLIFGAVLVRGLFRGT